MPLAYRPNSAYPGEVTGAPRGRVRRVVRPVVAGIFLILLTCTPAAYRVSAATDESSEFTETATASPTGEVDPGGTVRFTLSVGIGDAVSTSSWTATDTVPAGTALLPGSQTCGTGGGTCSETSTGSILEWDIPAGAGPRTSFEMSFAVSVATDNPPPEIQTGFNIGGAGCPANATCTVEAPEVVVSATPTRPQSLRAASLESPTTTIASMPPSGPVTGPASDEQNLIVRVPDCDLRGKKVRCKDPNLNHGAAAQAGAQAGASGAPSSAAPIRALAATGDNQIHTAEAALACLLSGSLLVVASAFIGRRGIRRAAGGASP